MDEHPETAGAQQPMMTQTALYPWALDALVRSWRFKPGYRARLEDMDRGQGSVGLTLVITTMTHESIHELADDRPLPTPGQEFREWPVTRVNHLFIVPAASYNRASWMRWLLDRCLDVEVHEACEFFRIDGERVFAPHHGEGEDPYTIWHLGTPEAASKRFTDK